MLAFTCLAALPCYVPLTANVNTHDLLSMHARAMFGLVLLLLGIVGIEGFLRELECCEGCA